MTRLEIYGPVGIDKNTLANDIRRALVAELGRDRALFFLLEESCYREVWAVAFSAASLAQIISDLGYSNAVTKERVIVILKADAKGAAR